MKTEMPDDERRSALLDLLSEYRLKQTATDIWSTRERLCLASSVLRSGDQNWVSVSRAIRPFGECNRPNDWFSQKNCALQYADLLEKVESPKRKRGERGEIDTPGALIVRKLTLERIEELKKIIQEEQQRHKRCRRDIELLRAGQIDDRLEELLKQIQDEQRAKEIAEQELQKWAKERELQQAALRAAARPSSKTKKMSSRYLQEVQRSSSQSEHSEPDSMLGSPLSVEVEDPPSPPSQGTPEVERPCTPQRKVVSPLPHATPSTPPTPPAISTSLLTSLLKSPTPSSPVSSVSGLCSLTPSPVHQHKEQSSPRSHLTPSFFNPSAARQLATGTLSPSTTSSTVPRFSPTCTTVDTSRPSSVQMSPHSATSSAPTLSKLLELPPSTPGGCLPSLPFLTASPSVSSPVASQETTSSPLESSNSMDTTADDASVPCLVSSPVKLSVEEVTAPLVAEPSETPCEIPAVETVESEPEPFPAPEEPMEVTEDVPEDTSPSEVETKVEPKEEDMEEDEDQAISPAGEADSMVETVASEEMVVETVIEDSLSSGPNVDDDKESVQSDPEHGTGADQETKPESEGGKEASEIPAEHVCSESESKDKDDKDDIDEQLVADESDSVKDALKSETNDDELPPESPDAPLKKDEQTQEGDVPEDHQPTADEDDDDAEESKDAWAPGTVSSPSPAGETMSNLDEPQSEDMDDDKLKDDKSSIDDAKTPETPSGTEPDTKDDGSQHIESGTEDGTGELSKHLLGGSVTDSVPNSPASVLQGEDSEVFRDYKVWKKSIMLVWRAAANHKYANVFLHPVTDEMAPGYHSIVYRPMDLLTIKKNIESGYIKTTLEFQRDMMLMFQNAIMYNSSDHDVFQMAIEMQKEVMGHIQLMVKTTETKSLRGRDGREKKVEFGKDDKGDERKKKISLPAEEPVAKKRRMRANE
ncbi:bromodomain-containing protein 8 isoform X5 [Dermacentor silvarum]|uniref:bromodomain-containing protein 8 isoform X5 n=1 Tax=Dermacentor silvarum TaxID=543639 RepID=UPI00189783C8|nr:bromodomain-containing protein 8 isoform X5 [Dermacentor silvarum]